MGSLSEWQQFFRTGAKPPRRFWDRASALLMAGDGWKAEWRVGIVPPTDASLAGVWPGGFLPVKASEHRFQRVYDADPGDDHAFGNPAEVHNGLASADRGE